MATNDKKPITRTRQEVKNIDVDTSKFVTKEDQYAYGINSFTTENDSLTSLELKAKDGELVKTSINSYWKRNIPSTSDPTIDKLYIKSYSGKHYNYIQNTNTKFIIHACPTDNNEYTSLTIGSRGLMLLYGYGNTFLIGGESEFGWRQGEHYCLFDKNFNKRIFQYQHTLTISKGNEFEGLVIKYTTRPTNETTSTAITTPELFIKYIQYIKDVVGYRLENGSVIPSVFTYEDSTLKLNGEEIDVNSLTITDSVVKLEL